MKKLTTIALFLVFAIFVAGCSQNADDMDENRITTKVIESNSPEELIANMCKAFVAKDVNGVIALTHPETRRGVRGGRMINSTVEDLKARFEAYDIQECKAGAIETVPVKPELKKEFKEKHNINVSLIAKANYVLKTGSNPDAFVDDSVDIVKVGGKWYIFP